MPNVIDPGTIACVTGTMSGDIYDTWITAIGVPVTSSVDDGLRQMAFVIANGVVDNIVTSITDSNVLQVLTGQIVGSTGGGGSTQADILTRVFLRC